ncbi:hypothetical protein QEH59_18385 [Coraliomargarita sp. SDUM461004]|uniref:Uncharacterized protein n=1 Tax=Thalassobacterium sedimentorum TaxID=3041258 RepID=A0ABU1AS23_9BACT|nr:hypothetical protein [Coraliomargarita sp. SDUM461004]MDQ8196403.1 hypothetical protein [Coraliomargarita sp. SDUM461004]
MKLIASLMIIAGVLHYIFPVICKVQSFEVDLTWRTSELAEAKTENEEEMKESIVFMGSHADSAISQWRTKSAAGSGLLIIFGLITFIIGCKSRPEPVDAANASNAASVNLNQSARIR